MKNDELKALERIGGIDGELIEAAESVGRKRKRFGWIYAAAACLALGVGLFAASKLLGDKPLEQTAQAGQETAAPAEAAERKVFYSNGNMDNESIPGPGKTSISYPLHNVVFRQGEYAESTEYEDGFFAVDIKISNALYDIQAAREAEFLAACTPDYHQYWSDYGVWFKEVFGRMSPEEREEILQGHWESSPEQADLLLAEFDKYELEEYGEEKLAAMKAADERVKALKEYDPATPENVALLKERVAAEKERLASLGLDVTVSEDGLYITGFLTREQLASFPADPLYGYYIFWQGEDNVIDE